MDGNRREPRQAGACVDYNGNKARYQQQHAVEDDHAEHPFSIDGSILSTRPSIILG
jgi:hypothetical protein